MKNNKKIHSDIPKNTAMASNEISWFAFEFENHLKVPAWFLAGGFLAVALLVVAAITKNFLFFLVIILSSFSLFIWTQKKAKRIKFKLTSRGIIIDKILYNYENLNSFWIFYEPPETKYLSIESKKFFMPKIIIPLAAQAPDKIREFLLKYLPEKEHHESAIDALGKYLRY